MAQNSKTFQGDAYHEHGNSHVVHQARENLANGNYYTVSNTENHSVNHGQRAFEWG